MWQWLVHSQIANKWGRELRNVSSTKISAPVKYRVEVILCLFLTGVVLWHYRDAFLNPALFGDDYMNIARSGDFSLGTRLKGFLAPNNSYDNRPLGNLLYILFYRCFGVSPAPYIALLFGLHLINALLGFFLARRLLRNTWLAALASSAWAVNFNVANNVYSFNVIYDSLAFFWWTAALLLYLHDREKESSTAKLGALLCFFMCTRSKEVGVMFAPSILAYEIAAMDWTAWRNLGMLKSTLARILRKQWPFHVIAILFVVFYTRNSAWGLNSVPTHPYYLDLSYRAFREGMEFYLSFVTFNHRVFQGTTLIGLGFGIAFVWAALLRQRVLWYTLATFVLALLPVIFLVNSRAQIYLYTPLYSLIVTLVGLAGHSLLRVQKRGRYVGATLAYAALVLMCLQYLKTDSKYAGYIRASYANQRSIAGEIVSCLRRWYPTVPDNARFYFRGMPDDIPNPELYVEYMPRLLYGGWGIRSYSASNSEEIVVREQRQGGGRFYFFEIGERGNGGRLGGAAQNIIEDRTAEVEALLRTAPPPSAEPPVLTPQPGVRLTATPSRLRAGTDTVVYRIEGLKTGEIDMLYKIDDELQPPILDWRMDDHDRIMMFVASTTRKGVYHIIGIRRSGTLPTNAWISVNARLVVE